MKSKSDTYGSLKKLKQVVLMASVIYLWSMSPLLFPAQKFGHISLEQGLSHGAVYSIVQDARGMMWFGTEDGLNKYDGFNITTYHHEPSNPNSLSSSDFGKILIDTSGIMWFGTWGGGLNRYDPVTGTFTHFRHVPQDPTSLSEDRIEFLFRDRRGVLWVGTENRGLNCLDEATGRFIHYRFNPAAPNGLGNDSTKAIIEDGEGHIWIGTNGGLDCYSPVDNQFIHYRHEPGNPSSLSNDSIRALCRGANGLIWIGTLGGGLSCFNLKKRTFKTYTYDPANPSGISDNDIGYLFLDSNGTLWIGTYNGGLNQFDTTTETFVYFKHSPKDSSSISHNRVSVIFEDRGKILWVGTRGGGINTLDLKPAKFKNYLFDSQDESGLPHATVLTITAGPGRETFWLGTDGSGVYRFEPTTEEFKKLLCFPASPDPLDHTRVRTLRQDKQGNLWVGTYRDGLIKMSLLGPDKYRPLVCTYNQDDPFCISSNRIQAILQDKEGDIWVGTQEGLNLLLPAPQPGPLKFRKFQAEEGKPGYLHSNYISTIYQDHSGTIWVGTAKGLHKIDKTNGRFTCYRHKPDEPGSLSHDLVQVIFEMPGKAATTTLWIGTENGLNKFSPAEGKFKHYPLGLGLPAERILAILAEDNGNLWIGTSHGLSRFNPDTGISRNYGVSDGLPSNGFYRDACLKMEGAGMFFSSINGLVNFFPDKVLDNPYVPPVQLTAIKNFNRDILFDKPLWAITEIQISYKESNISFEFAALDYTNPSRNRYAYKLEGFDHDWIDGETRHYVGYPRLPAGKYIFHVRGSNNDGVWNNNGISLKLTITPPWWGTWWFRVVGIGLIIALVFTLYHYRVQQIEARNKELSDSNARLEEQVVKRGEAEEALLESRERLSSVLHHASIIIWALDTDGVFTLSEGWGLAALGLKPGELVGQSIFQVYGAYPEILTATRRALAGEIVGSAVSIGNVAFELRYTPQINRFGEFSGTICVAIDETDRKRAEAEKALLEEQLRHVQKLETIGTLAGGIAHDFNNILGPILGYTEMAMEEIPRDNIAVKWLENVVLASQRARDLVQQILVFGRRDKQEYKPVLIQGVIREALKLIRASLPATIDILQDISDYCKPVLADPGQIHQVFMNLCINAKHAMQENGGTLTVHLRTARVNEALAQLYPKLKPGYYVRLTVSDTGHGMDDETLRRLFEPFYTTKKPGEGTGMGLSMVHGIVMGHGGEITVTSHLGKGSEFNVYLPVVNSQTVEEAIQSQGVPSGNEHILVVDDEESITVMAGLKLKQLGYQVTTFTDSVAALNYFKENQRQIDLVLSDQTMPKMTGVRLSRELKTLKPNVPVIIISGFSELVNQDNFHELGLEAYISKPFNSFSLGRTIREVLDKNKKISDNG